MSATRQLGVDSLPVIQGRVVKAKAAPGGSRSITTSEPFDPRLITGSGVPRPKAAISGLEEVVWLARPGEEGDEILAGKIEAVIRNLKAAQA